jgi:hypothetical protein
VFKTLPLSHGFAVEISVYPRDPVNLLSLTQFLLGSSFCLVTKKRALVVTLLQGNVQKKAMPPPSCSRTSTRGMFVLIRRLRSTSRQPIPSCPTRIVEKADTLPRSQPPSSLGRFQGVASCARFHGGQLPCSTRLEIFSWPHRGVSISAVACHCRLRGCHDKMRESGLVLEVSLSQEKRFLCCQNNQVYSSACLSLLRVGCLFVALP